MPYNLRKRNSNFSKHSPIASYRNFVRCGNPKCKVSCDKDRLYCEGCCNWFHYQCLGLSRKRYLQISSINKNYPCSSSCYASLLPFSETNHIDLLLTFNDSYLHPCKKCKKECLESKLMDCIDCYRLG